jgi:hypothetical protein
MARARQGNVDDEERDQIRRDLAAQKKLERQKQVSDEEKAQIAKDLAAQKEKEEESKK